VSRFTATEGEATDLLVFGVLFGFCADHLIAFLGSGIGLAGEAFWRHLYLSLMFSSPLFLLVLRLKQIADDIHRRGER
jgi:hypothetical protein